MAVGSRNIHGNVGTHARGRLCALRRAVAVSVLLLGLCASRPATAQPVSSELVVQRDPEAADCPDEAALHESITARLGEDPFVAPSLDGWLVDVWFLRPEPGRRSARILLYDAQRQLVGTRFIDSREPRCVELASAVTMSLAMVLEMQLLGARDAAPSETPQTPAPSSSSTVESEVAVDSTVMIPSDEPPTVAMNAAPVRARGGIEVAPFGHAMASLGAGFTPHPALLVGIGGGLQLGAHATVELEGRVTPPDVVSNASGQARVVFGGGAVSACARGGRFAACATCTLAATIATGTSGLATERARTFTVHPGLAGVYEQPLSPRVGLRVRLELLVAAQGVELEVVGRPLWSSPKLAGSLGIGLVYRRLVRVGPSDG